MAFDIKPLETYFFARLSEKSTWVNLFSLLFLTGITIPDPVVQSIATLGAVVANIVGAAIKDGPVSTNTTKTTT